MTSQWATTLASTTTSSGVLRQAQKLERAILLIGLKQPVEADQRGEQGRDPQDRGTDSRQQVEIRPEREGHQGDDGEKEHQAHGA